MADLWRYFAGSSDLHVGSKALRRTRGDMKAALQRRSQKAKVVKSNAPPSERLRPIRWAHMRASQTEQSAHVVSDKSSPGPV